MNTPRAVAISVTVNVLASAVFIALNAWALRQQLEETFVSLAILYGVVIVATNALLVVVARR